MCTYTNIFKVTRGHRNWHRSIRHIRLPNNDP